MLSLLLSDTCENQCKDHICQNYLNTLCSSADHLSQSLEQGSLLKKI